jgi:hypothetical protein
MKIRPGCSRPAGSFLFGWGNAVLPLILSLVWAAHARIAAQRELDAIAARWADTPPLRYEWIADD